jgi:hypothetical protein
MKGKKIVYTRCHCYGCFTPFLCNQFEKTVMIPQLKISFITLLMAIKFLSLVDGLNGTEHGRFSRTQFFLKRIV